MDGLVDNHLMPAVEEPKITSDATTGPAESATSIGSGGGDGSEASFPWSLTHEQQVHNLKENWRSAFASFQVRVKREYGNELYPWFVRVVAKLRVDPCLDSCKSEIDQGPLGQLIPGFRMNSFDVAILMGNLKMVQKILETSLDQKNIIRGPIVDETMFEKLLDTYEEAVKLYTPLHLAVKGGDSDIVNALLKEGVDVNALNVSYETPLDLACLNKDVIMLQQLLANDRYEWKDPLHVAVQNGNIDFMRKLLIVNVNAWDYRERTLLHYLATTDFSNSLVTKIIQYLHQDKALDVQALDLNGFSAFYVAILYYNTELVIALLDSFKDQIRLNEICDDDLGPPIQIAFEGGGDFKYMERALMECDDVRGYIEKLYKDRQAYVDAANANLVGAALIASITFASWLQPPLSYTSYSGEGYSSSVPAPPTSDLNYVDVEHNIALCEFWVFNALSFYFAIGTVVCGARSVLPRSHLFIKITVEKLRTNLLVTSILLVWSVLFVIIAFAIAGTIVLTPLVKYQWCMIVPIIVGGMVCIISLGFLVKGMTKIYFNFFDNTTRSMQKERNILSNIGYRVGYRVG